MNEPANAIHTIGHSNHPFERFAALLREAHIELLVDVRSIPASRRWPQFTRAPLARSLAAQGIDYLWLGERLGGKPGTGVVRDYESMAAQASFEGGIVEVLGLASRRHLALMCAEREPLDCHRTVLVGRHLAMRGAVLRHILADGRIEDHAALEERLLERQGLAADDLLSPRAERVQTAWALRGRKMMAT